jgi:hypothetical protein
MGPRVWVASVVAAVLLLGSCGGSGGDGSSSRTDGSSTIESSTSDDAGASVDDSTTVAGSVEQQAEPGRLVVGDVVDTDALDVLVDEFAALDADEQIDRVNELARQFERELYELSGLADVLGTPEAVEASIDDATESLGEFAADLEAAVSSAQLQGMRAPAQSDSAPNLTMGLFGGLMVSTLAGEAAVTSTNDGTTGSGALARGGSLTVTSREVGVSFEHASTDSQGVTTTLKTRNVIAPCPTPDGTFTASATIETSSVIGNGATGKRATLEVSITGTVDDTANVAGYDLTSRSQYADFTNSKGGFLDLTISVARGGQTSAEFTRGGGTITSEIIDTAVAFNRLMMMVGGTRVVDAAKLGWESGRCVQLDTTVSAGPTGLQPSASVTIGARPRSKIDEDRGPVGGTVTALLTGGAADVSPSSTPLPADAEFTYTAPGERDQRGTVSLEARSRRGVGRATIEFDTAQRASYRITGGDPPVDATVCDINAPFEVIVDYGVARFDFVYSGGLSGTATFTGSGMVTASGTATYTIEFPNGPDQPGTLTASGGGTFDLDGVGSETGSSGTQYVVTPIEPCAG